MKTASISLALLAACVLAAGSGLAAGESEALQQFGRTLFFDTRFSANRSLSCASCHDPDTGFSDQRESVALGAVSIGDDGASFGDRNAPSTAYVSLQPEFHKNAAGDYVGGHFYDGRAESLAEQAKEPFTNPAEMGLADAAEVIRRLRENASYIDTMTALFGTEVFATADTALDAMARSLAAFERSDEFAPFDSKYDRFLRGEYTLSETEEVGRVLFFSQLFNCHQCHLIDTRESFNRESFTSFKYHNIGVPVNVEVRTLNGAVSDYKDKGLRANPLVADDAQAGKFKVPTLRNVAVTPPYMHNGVFRDLETVILFYNKYTLSNPESQINPETGQPWGTPEISATIDHEILRQGQPISPLHLSAIIAFLEILTDRRYESLLTR